MNVKTGIIAVIFCVGLGVIIAGQQLQIRTVSFEAGKLNRESKALAEQNRVLAVKLDRKRNPVEMRRKAIEAGLNLIPPESDKPFSETEKENE